MACTGSREAQDHRRSSIGRFNCSYEFYPFACGSVLLDLGHLAPPVACRGIRLLTGPFSQIGARTSFLLSSPLPLDSTTSARPHPATTTAPLAHQALKSGRPWMTNLIDDGRVASESSWSWRDAPVRQEKNRTVTGREDKKQQPGHRPVYTSH
jgi:hypothetical protein